MTQVLREKNQNRKAIRGPDGKLRRVRGPNEQRKRYLYAVGVDGEGVTVDGNHRYVMLQWSDKTGARRDRIVRPEGICTTEALDFLLSIPRGGRPFSFAFNYDLTKVLVDLPDELNYKLFRPDTRKHADGDPRPPSPIRWGKYALNLVGTRFTVASREPDGRKRRTVIWDTFKFYQKRFVVALEDWKVANKELIAQIEKMKDKRGDFTLDMLEDMSRYCYDECAFLADLTERLIDACQKAGIDLRVFYGAGSLADALLTDIGIKERRRDAGEQNSEMQDAIARAFFGGRFENRVVGVIDGPLYNYDICSAYPYQLRFLPCLDHGRWEKTTSRMALEKARHALVQYNMCSGDPNLPWAPLPFRTEGGSVVFPYECDGGWVWRDEYLVAERYFNNVHFTQAWLYHSDCSCIPFERVPELYLRRLALGKDGPGIILKLGLNSCYGKLAQSIGHPKFSSWIWAGMVTSGTRAQLLEAICCYQDRGDVIALATDAIVTRKPLPRDLSPRDTGTGTLLDGTPNKLTKRLGAWDCKLEERPTFLARPGIYFPMRGNEALSEDELQKELEKMRARGIGRKELFTAGTRLVQAWRANKIKDIELGALKRFCGAKTSIRMVKQGEYRRADYYGQWVDRVTCASLSPLPKREFEIDRHGDWGSLRLRKMQGMSAPYRRALTPEVLSILLFRDQSEEQPEGMFSSEFDADDLGG